MRLRSFSLVASAALSVVCAFPGGARAAGATGEDRYQFTVTADPAKALELCRLVSKLGSAGKILSENGFRSPGRACNPTKEDCTGYGTQNPVTKGFLSLFKATTTTGSCSSSSAWRIGLNAGTSLSIAGKGQAGTLEVALSYNGTKKALTLGARARGSAGVTVGPVWLLPPLFFPITVGFDADAVKTSSASASLQPHLKTGVGALVGIPKIASLEVILNTTHQLNLQTTFCLAGTPSSCAPSIRKKELGMSVKLYIAVKLLFFTVWDLEYPRGKSAAPVEQRLPL